MQLSTDIYFVYIDLTETTLFSMSHYGLIIIQQKIISGLYILSPLQVQYFRKVDLNQFFYDMMLDCSDIMLENCSEPDMLYAIIPDKENVLVLMGLSMMLLHLSYVACSKMVMHLSYVACEKMVTR